QVRQPAMRDGGAAADAGGAEPLALEKDLENRALWSLGQARRPACKLLQRLSFIGRSQVRDDPGRREHVADIHQAPLRAAARRLWSARSGSIQPTFPSRRRYTRLRLPWALLRKRRAGRSERSRRITASLTLICGMVVRISAMTSGFAS